MSAVEAIFAEIERPAEIMLDLPAPPSVNRIRRYDFGAANVVKTWQRAADGFVYAAKCRQRDPVRLTRLSRFEVYVTLSEAHTGIDLDNALKVLIDFLKRIDAIEDDAPRHMRRVVVEWGEAPEGCRVRVREWRA